MMAMPKSVRIGRFLIRSKLPITREQMKLLTNSRHSDRTDAIALTMEKVLRGTWTIVEIGK